MALRAAATFLHNPRIRSNGEGGGEGGYLPSRRGGELRVYYNPRLVTPCRARRAPRQGLGPRFLSSSTRIFHHCFHDYSRRETSNFRRRNCECTGKVAEARDGRSTNILIFDYIIFKIVNLK